MPRPQRQACRIVRLPILERAFRNAFDTTGLVSAAWRAMEQAFEGGLEFVELHYNPSPPMPYYRSLLARGPNDIAASGARREGEGPAAVFAERSGICLLEPADFEKLDLDDDHAMLVSRCRTLAIPLSRGGVASGALLIGFVNGFLQSEACERRVLSAGRRLQVILLRRLEQCVAISSQAETHHHALILLQLLRGFGAHSKSTEIAAKALDFFVSEMGFRRALIARVNNDDGAIYGIDSRGFEDVVRLIRFQYKAAEDIFSQVAREGETVVADLAEDDPRLPPFFHGRGMRQAVVLPMRVEDEIVGVVLAENDPDARPLLAESVDALQWMTDLLGQSLYVSSIYESLRRTAETDPLTGVYNRFALTKILEEEVPRVKRFGQSLSLLMIDLCDFKKFNDVYGHVVGDRVLKTVAALLLKSTRKTDKVVRFGGDEFLVLMPNTTEEKAAAVKARIEQSMREHNEAAGHESEVFMLSIGLKSADGDSVDNIFEEADEEMFKKKAAQSRQKLYNALTSNNQEELEKSDNFVAVLIKNLIEREPHFLDHARHVMIWCQAICQQIGADSDTIERVSLAALLHDIGKIALPSGLLTKPGPLTREDLRHIRLHPIAGSDFLSGHKFLGDLRIIINHHHERWDGKTAEPHPGYPTGLSGELIPLGSRIIRVAEMYDDLVSPRPYRPKPYTWNKALDLLRSEAGHSLDPRLVDAFCEYVEMIHEPLGGFSA